ncbi:MAG: hypothetical protein HZB35_05660 [Nitrospirae bacterium]|nr:hypothetical protein [Nitrospirota bacterium]
MEELISKIQGQTGGNSVTVRVTDPAGGFSEQIFTITVGAAGGPALGDANGDGVYTMDDYNLIVAGRNTPATGPDDPRDLDRDGRITVLDARKWVVLYLS